MVQFRLPMDERVAPTCDVKRTHDGESPTIFFRWCFENCALSNSGQQRLSSFS